MRECAVFNNHEWEEMASNVFHFCNAHSHKFHIVLETQGWKVQLIFFQQGLSFYFLASLLIKDSDY